MSVKLRMKFRRDMGITPFADNCIPKVEYVEWLERRASNGGAQPPQATNIVSHKFPSSTEVWNHVTNSIDFNEDYAREEEVRSVSQIVYEFLRRKLLA